MALAFDPATKALTVVSDSALTVEKDRKASPTRVPSVGSAVTYTWDGKVPVQNARVYRHWARTSEWVRGAIIIRKSQVSSAEWDIGPYDQTKPWSKRAAREIKALFQTPNPANDSYRTFIEPVTEDLLTLDAGCIEKVRNLQGKLLELWPVNAEHVRVNAKWEGSPTEPRYYWYPDGFQPKDSWRNDDFVYMMMNPRTDSPVGLPPLETLRNAVEAEIAAHEYNRRQVENAAPDGIINLGEGFTEPQVNRFREFFESEVAGRGPLGFIGGSKDPGFIKFRDSNRDQQFLEWQIYLVRKIAVVFGLTPQDLGVTFDINRSTAETQIQISEDRGLRPLMSLIQEFLTEEIVWDRSFGGPANNLAFRFTALNLKESTAKAGIYEKALAGVPWRTINEARIDEGREPLPEFEDKFIMATPQGALDISDVPTVREFLEMQQAAKQAPPASSSSKDLESLAELASLVLSQWAPTQQPAPAPPEVRIESGAVQVNVTNEAPEPPVFEVDPTPMKELGDGLMSAIKELGERPDPVVNVASPDVQVAAPIVNVEPPAIDLSALAAQVAELKEALTRQAEAPKEQPIVRRVVNRDAQGRIIEVIDHRGE